MRRTARLLYLSVPGDVDQAAEGVTAGDLEHLLDELRLLLPSTGSLLQRLLQEKPLLRSALLQAELLLGRLGGTELLVRLTHEFGNAFLRGFSHVQLTGAFLG